jgi:hypothetical protein
MHATRGRHSTMKPGLYNGLPKILEVISENTFDSRDVNENELSSKIFNQSISNGAKFCNSSAEDGSA